jgi:secreted trypsin-like serine protease
VDSKSACFADSGGPAYFEIQPGEFVVGGVTSWGDGFCAKIGAYTSVPAFSDFIVSSVETLQATN